MVGKRAMEVMADVCAALDFSHRNGIVHRDVKPANVMITQTGAVKVMDFGIARALHDGQAAVTQTAAVIGTAQYLSPEQARGESVDARSDVYSAGCVLYELITGEPPFTGDSPVAVAYQHVREDPRTPSSVNPAVSPALDAIVLKALAKNPMNRYQSAAEMRADLVRVLSGQRPSAPAVFTDDDRTSIMSGARPTTLQHAADEDEYDPDYEEEQRQRRRKRWMTAGLVALGAVIVALVAWLTTSLIGGNSDTGKVTVPATLVGETEPAAIQTLSQAGLKWSITPVPCQPDIANNQPPACTSDQIGRVIRTDPPGNTKVAPQSSVTLYIGNNPQSVAVPQLKGSSPDDATNALKAQDLQVGSQQAQDTDDPTLVGKVVATDPPAGTSVPKGSTVNLIVGKLPDLVTLQDYTNQTQQQATSNLQSLGFQVTVQQVDGAAPLGTVIKQDPPGGTKVKRGSTVTLSVSKGNEITVPSDIIGMTPNQAQNALAALGWAGTLSQSPQQVTNPSQIGRVVGSNPTPGQALGKTQPVVLAVGVLFGSGPYPTG